MKKTIAKIFGISHELTEWAFVLEEDLTNAKESDYVLKPCLRITGTDNKYIDVYNKKISFVINSRLTKTTFCEVITMETSKTVHLELVNDVKSSFAKDVLYPKGEDMILTKDQLIDIYYDRWYPFQS